MSFVALVALYSMVAAFINFPNGFLFQVYNDVVRNGWLVGARIIHGTLNGLCFGCMPSFINWVGLDLDFGRIRAPGLITTG